jgi:hypothetical protein
MNLLPTDSGPLSWQTGHMTPMILLLCAALGAVLRVAVFAAEPAASRGERCWLRPWRSGSPTSPAFAAATCLPFGLGLTTGHREFT